MFKNTKIAARQLWNEQIINFDPDSSPAAWEHYKKYYIKNGHVILGNYNFKKLNFYNYYRNIGDESGIFKNNEWKNYINCPSNNKKRYNRLFALSNTTKTECKNSKEYCCASSRLGGECDFNFNCKKQTLFKAMICGDNAAEKKLEKCNANHHTLINFSLMQGMGNMQSVKGNDKHDRLDVFVHQLSLYFSREQSNIMTCTSGKNKDALISYLNNFNNIYDYMEKVYFIKNETFIDKIIEQGQLPMNTCDDVVRYMDLANEFWSEKEYYFNQQVIEYKEESILAEEYQLNKDKYPHAYECPKCNRIITNEQNYSIPPMCDECSCLE